MFYHGTAHQFEVGDRVETGHEANWSQSDQYVYFTTSRNTAAYFAEQATNRRSQRRVYRVAPTGDYTTDPNMPERDDGTQDSYRSSAALTVLGLVEWSADYGD